MGFFGPSKKKIDENIRKATEKQRLNNEILTQRLAILEALREREEIAKERMKQEENHQRRLMELKKKQEQHMNNFMRRFE